MIILLCIFVIPFLKYNLEVLYHDGIYLHSLAIGQSHAVAFSGMQCLQCPAVACSCLEWPGVACSRLLLQGQWAMAQYLQIIRWQVARLAVCKLY